VLCFLCSTCPSYREGQCSYFLPTMARPVLGVVWLVCVSFSCALQPLKPSPDFLQRGMSGTVHVMQPKLLDGSFVQSVIGTPGDVLVLLYSPTCPDCEWFEHKIWRNVAAKLDGDPNLSVMTVADPGYAAPKPFEHDNNPALFFAPAGNKLTPMMFPQARFAEYLGGLPTNIRPQDQQDSDFVEDILAFAKGAAGVRLSQQATPTSKSKALLEVQSLADQEWISLQKKWAGAKDYPAPPPAVVAPGGSASTWPADWSLPETSHPKASLMVSSQTKQTVDTSSEKLDADQMWVLRLSQEAEKVEKAETWAVAYAQKYVQDHPGKGYTAEGVFKYSLPYYQEQVRKGRI